MSELDRLRNQIAALERKVSAPMPESERAEIAAAMSRADAVERAWGRNDAAVLAAVPGESALDYRRRLLRQYQQYSPRWKGARVEAMGYDAIGNVEQDVYKDAATAAQDPRNFKPGELRAIQERDAAGRLVTKWVGDSMSWRAPFMSGGQRGYINDPRQG